MKIIAKQKLCYIIHNSPAAAGKPGAARPGSCNGLDEQSRVKQKSSAWIKPSQAAGGVGFGAKDAWLNGKKWTYPTLGIG
jgi:hypothetical protein